MRKFIPLLTICIVMVLSTNLYAQIINASAEVLAAITYTQGNSLDFGNVTPGINKTVSPDNGGTLTIEGENSASIALGFTLPGEGAGGTYTYQLETDGGDELELTFSDGDAAWTSGASYSSPNTFDPTTTNNATLDLDGITVWIGGTVNPTNSQATGNYTGTITVSAVYN